MVQLRSALWTLSGVRLVRHRVERQSCLADVLVAAYRVQLPFADPNSIYKQVARRSTPLSWVTRVAGCGGSLQECCSAPLPPADLALGFGERSPSPPDDISDLKERVNATLTEKGLERSAGDRNELPIDYRFLDLLLRASADPEVLLGSFAQGVKVGPGTRMPRLHATDPRGDGGLSRKGIRKIISSKCEHYTPVTIAQHATFFSCVLLHGCPVVALFAPCKKVFRDHVFIRADTATATSTST